MRHASSGTPARRLALAAALLAALLAVLAPRARAQGTVAAADSLLAAGRPFAAETAYYDEARRRPRDPAARLALGRYLVSRGATRVGAVLLEEARFFGGDAGAVARELAPAYARLGDWAALAALPSPPVPAGDRARARWLTAHPSTRRGPDAVTVAYAGDGVPLLGHFAIRIGTVTVDAEIDADARGLVISPGLAADSRAGVRTFGSTGARLAGSEAAVAAAVHAGELTLGNVPVTVAPAARGARVRVGLDFLGTLAPTFDAGARRATLRKGGRVPPSLRGTHIPTLLPREGTFVIVAGRSVSLASAGGVAAIAGARWTWDARRGELVAEWDR